MKRLFILIIILLLHSISYAKLKINLEKYLELGQYNRVREKIEKFKPEEKLYWEAKLFFYESNYTKAITKIDKLIDADKKNKEKWLPLKYYYQALEKNAKDFVEIASEHFVLRLTSSDGLLSYYALQALEKIYEKNGEVLDFFPEGKILVEIYPDKQSFSMASTLSEEILEKSGTVGICKFNKIMLLSPRQLPMGFRWLDTLSHEYMHFIINRVSEYECPLWLHEGIARYHDTIWRLDEPYFLSQGAENLLIKARDKKKYVRLKEMYPSLVYLDNQTEISLAFAEVSVAVKMMREKKGKDFIPKLLKAIKTEKNPNKAFKKVLKISESKFQKELFEYIGNMELKEEKGAAIDEVLFKEKKEEEYIGADLRGLIRLGDRMRKINRYDAAHVKYEEALKKEPANPVILLKLAKVLIGLNRKQQAEEKLLIAIKNNPNYVTLYQLLGKLYYDNEQFDKAKDILNESIAINPFYPDDHRYLSKIYLAKKNLERTVYELQTTLMLNPSDAESKFLLKRLTR